VIIVTVIKLIYNLCIYYRIKLLGNPECKDYMDLIKVLLIDYGHTENVPLRDIFHLDDEFLKIPPQCARLSLGKYLKQEQCNVTSRNASLVSL
jgi:hypothetical protein